MTLSITDFYSSTIAKSPNRSLYRILIDEQFACTIHGNRKFSRYAQTSPLTCVYTCVSHVGQRTLLLSISMEFYYVSMIHCTRCFYSLKKILQHLYTISIYTFSNKIIENFSLSIFKLTFNIKFIFISAI